MLARGGCAVRGARKVFPDKQPGSRGLASTWELLAALKVGIRARREISR